MKKQGISLMILVTTVIIISILTTTTVYSGKGINDNLKGLEFATNIMKIENSYKAIEEKPLYRRTSLDSIVDVSKFTNAEINKYFPGETVENVQGKKVIKLKYIKPEELGIKIENGKLEEGKEDYYAISSNTNRVYYLDGLKLGDEIYYYLTPELRERYNAKNIKNEENNKNSNNYIDKQAPNITVGNILENKQTGDIVINNVIAKDDFGKIKTFKYELEKIDEKESVYYFSENGMIVKNNKIHINDFTQKVTIYAEDYAGNYKIINLNCDNNYMKPKLANNMIPIKFVNGKWVMCSNDDPLWYDYSSTSKKYANVMLTDGKYKKAEFGKIVEDEELGSMFVWIPRFAYSINKFHKKISDDEKAFEIMFMKNETQGLNGQVYPYDFDKYPKAGEKTPMIIHPAFKVGNENLSGIWIAKFPVNTDKKVLPNGEFDVTNKEEAVNNAAKFTTESNTHLIKNIEWGAVAYLTNSKYGNNVKTNSSKIVANGVYKVEANKLSSTGNVYGIYDLNTRHGEYVEGSINKNIKGDAVYETTNTSLETSYYGKDKVLIKNKKMPHIVRGGVNGEISESGVFAMKFVKENNEKDLIKYRPSIYVK